MGIVITLTIIGTIVAEIVIYLIYKVLKDRQTKRIRENLPSYMRYYP